MRGGPLVQFKFFRVILISLTPATCVPIQTNSISTSPKFKFACVQTHTLTHTQISTYILNTSLFHFTYPQGSVTLIATVFVQTWASLKEEWLRRLLIIDMSFQILFVHLFSFQYNENKNIRMKASEKELTISYSFCRNQPKNAVKWPSE